MNALIRWLESEGGGSRNSSGEEYHTLLFADDSTLLTESTKAMQKLLGTVERFSEWSGIRVNLRKSEISGYDFRNRRPIWVRDLTICEGKMTYLRRRRSNTSEFEYQLRET